MPETVAFIGTGAMGAPMASNLIDAGFTVRAWNRTSDRARALEERGAIACTSIGEALQGARFVVSIVADDDATRSVMLGPEGVIALAAPGTVIIDSSTNTPAMAREVADTARACRLVYLDAPVSGSVPQSRNRELVFMVGGEAPAFAAAQPLFEAMGRMSVHMGASGAGATIKLINNMLSGTMNAALAEAVSVALAAGIDGEVAQTILEQGAAGCRLMGTKIPKILARDFSPQFQLGLMDKDLRYFLSLAQYVDRPAPIASLVRSQMQAARRSGYGMLDVSAVWLYTSGEKPPSQEPQQPGQPDTPPDTGAG
jgi:3-hydroxyisobutyrate dehydrogenase